MLIYAEHRWNKSRRNFGKERTLFVKYHKSKGCYKTCFTTAWIEKKEAGRAYCFIRTKTNLKNNHAGFI